MALTAKKLDQVRQNLPVKEVQKEDLVRVNLNVPESQRTKWKIAAIERKQSLGDLIAEAVEAYLNK